MPSASSISVSDAGVPAPSRIVVFGAGAIGSTLGGHLAKAGRDVVLIGRGAHLAAMRDGGLVLEGPQDRACCVEVRVTDDPAAAGPCDVLVFTVKAHQLAEAVAAARPLLRQQTTVITAINGLPWWFFQGIGGAREGLTLESVDPDGWIAKALSAHHALGCVVYCAAEMAAPGVVRHGPRARFILGDPGGRLAGPLEAASNILAVPGVTAPIASDIRHDVWMKLWGNAVINPVTALTLTSVGRSVSAPESTGTIAALLEEVKRVFEALGHRTDVSVDKRIADAARLTTHRSSMLQDLEAGRALEIEAITGAVVELAHILNIAVPRLETVLSLVRLRATATN